MKVLLLALMIITFILVSCNNSFEEEISTVKVKINQRLIELNQDRRKYFPHCLDNGAAHEDISIKLSLRQDTREAIVFHADCSKPKIGIMNELSNTIKRIKYNHGSNIDELPEDIKLKAYQTLNQIKKAKEKVKNAEYIIGQLKGALYEIEFIISDKAREHNELKRDFENLVDKYGKLYEKNVAPTDIHIPSEKRKELNDLWQDL